MPSGVDQRRFNLLAGASITASRSIQKVALGIF